jgi:uncharacterized protein (TIGR00369 family)
MLELAQTPQCEGEAMPRSVAEIENFFRSVLDVPAHRMFGLSLVSWKAGEAVLGFTAGNNCLGANGEVHGGVVSLLLEPAAMFALLPMLPEDRYAVTADIHTQFMRRVRPQSRVELRGRVVRLGAQMAFCEATALCDGQPCVSSRITNAIRRLAST